jgi:2-iminobutanoate/2-iminopropanoate deaminase
VSILFPAVGKPEVPGTLEVPGTFCNELLVLETTLTYLSQSLPPPQDGLQLEQTNRRENMGKEIIATEKAPGAVGPYSQGVRTGDLIYTAGQLGLVPGTKEFAGSDVETQTRQALENVKAILESAGSCLKHVVKTTVFLQNMGEFGKMNGVYAEFFPENPPARSAVQAAALPLGGRVEIEAVAEACDCESPEECGCDCH